MAKIRGGTIASTTLVAISARLASGLVATDERITGIVCELIVWVRSRANRNSLYDAMNANAPAAARPGAADGGTILCQSGRRPHPSICAASSTSIGKETM